MNWLLENIVPTLVTAIASALVGGGIGFRIGVKMKQHQSQKAGDNSRQIQAGHDVNIRR